MALKGGAGSDRQYIFAYEAAKKRFLSLGFDPPLSQLVGSCPPEAEILGIKELYVHSKRAVGRNETKTGRTYQPCATATEVDLEVSRDQLLSWCERHWGEVTSLAEVEREQAQREEQMAQTSPDVSSFQALPQHGQRQRQRNWRKRGRAKGLGSSKKPPQRHHEQQHEHAGQNHKRARRSDYCCCILDDLICKQWTLSS